MELRKKIQLIYGFCPLQNTICSLQNATIAHGGSWLLISLSEGKMTVCQYKCYSRVLFLGMLKAKLNSVCVCLCVSTASILDLHFLTLRPHCGKLPKSACCGFLRLCWSFCAVCSCVSAAPIDAWLNQLVEKSEVCRGKRGMVRLLHFQLGSLALQSFKVNDHLWEHTL